jgi:hypothetical protein
MDARDAKTSYLPQGTMKNSFKKAIKSIGRVASFHTGEDMLPLEDLMKKGGQSIVRPSAVSSTLRSKKLPVSISKILKEISKVASFHPGEDFQVLKGCKIQNKST